MIDAVAFDAADTLFFNPALIDTMAAAAHQAGWRGTSETLAAGLDRVGARGLWPDDCDTHAERVACWEKFFGLVAREAGITDETVATACARAAAVQVATPDSYQLFPDADPVLGTLRARGYSLAIISNFDALLDDILDRLDLRAKVDVVVASYQVKSYKPAARIFLEAARRLGVQPARMAFVGDSPYSDMGGASAVGMEAILLDRNGRHSSYRGKRISLLTQVLGLLAAPG